MFIGKEKVINMKYIRTKDGIYEVIEENDNYYKVKYFIKDKEMTTIKSKNENDLYGIDYAFNQADTIEELCDEFVGIDKTIVNGHQLLRAIPYKCSSFWNGGVYGAIWTDKGLIYVAKRKGNLN